MKLVITDGYCENPGDLSWEPLKQFGELVIYDRTEDDEDKIIDRIGDADIAIINKVPITERIMDACPNLKAIAILATGYNGAPSGIKTCRDKGVCLRDKLGIPSGTQMQTCYAVHAEQNAIVQAAKLGVSIDGATLYCTHQPCSMCCKMIINSGIKRVIYKEGYPDPFTLELFAEAGVTLERFEEEI